MDGIMTPQELWENFDDTLPLNAVSEIETDEESLRIEKVTFDGRETGQGRVRVYAKYATNPQKHSTHTVLILPDANRSVEDALMMRFVSEGYNVLMVDYRGYEPDLLPAWRKPAPKIIRRLVVHEEPAPAEEPAAEAPAEDPVQPSEVPAEELNTESAAAEETSAEGTEAAAGSAETEAGAPAEETAETEPAAEPEAPAEGTDTQGAESVEPVSEEVSTQETEDSSADNAPAEEPAADTETPTEETEPAEDTGTQVTVEDIIAEAEAEAEADAETPVEEPVEAVADTEEQPVEEPAEAVEGTEVPAEEPAEAAEDTEEQPVEEPAVPTEIALEAAKEPEAAAPAEDITEDAEPQTEDTEAPAEDIETPVEEPVEQAVVEAETGTEEQAEEPVSESVVEQPAVETEPVAEGTEEAVGQADVPAEESAEAQTDEPAEEPAAETEQTEQTEQTEASDTEASADIEDTADAEAIEAEEKSEEVLAEDEKAAEATPAEGADEGVQLSLDLDLILGEVEKGDTEDTALEEQLEEPHTEEETAAETPAEGEAPAEETAAEEEKPAEPEPEPEPVKPPEPEYEEIIVEEPLPPHPGEYYTVYPDGIKYANYEICKDNLCFADNGADKTCWYEWTAVGLYARKYIEERTGNDNIALVGVREGGEVIWKMAAVRQFRCAIPVCAAGFKTSAGKLKFEKPVSAPLKAARPEAKEAERHGKEKKGARAEEEESHMNYNFIAGVDSQAYAPNVMCPVLMLCSVNDPRFDYDRAYDTYLRINPDYIQESGLSYAMNSNSFIDKESIADMYIFLRKFLMGHHVFQPRMVAVDIDVGRQQELLARVMADQEGVVKKFRVYYAEDTVNPVLRTWINAEPIKGGAKNEYSLNVYEGAKTVFVIAAAEYTNGYTSWSNVTVKTISGRFRNMLHRSPLIYSSLLQNDGFISVGLEKKAIGGIILEEGVSAAPENIELDGIKGIYAPDGMMTYRISKPRYAPDDKSILSLDINTVNDANIYITITDLKTHEDYVFTDYLTGGLWQSLKLSACTFKCGRKPLNSFCREAVLTIRAEGLYAVNNIMWL